MGVGGTAGSPGVRPWRWEAPGEQPALGPLCPQGHLTGLGSEVPGSWEGQEPLPGVPHHCGTHRALRLTGSCSPHCIEEETEAQLIVCL